MKMIQKYYDNTEKNEPRENVKKFLKIETTQGNAIELGCGAGVDTIYLIKNNWNVIAIDREDVEERIKNRFNKEDLERFKFKKQNFEDIVLEKNNLIVANFSLPFCQKNKFDELWNKIKNSILSNRIFCW